ncbi:family transcriptional regulator [Chlorella sorokiniana]|uniref:Family transcriptional regulator n=1 Tax=Chlorella sorokiniana TaxID=3076 RepID=A0A2P6U3F4_CHLSO|nr:family transcriptional regulator [Chlorella sorokiniana]|eukprot:PRW60843.1 family transcriptional regulator [Chlorella sorokiniana]
MEAAPTRARAAASVAADPPGGEERSFSRFGRAAQFNPQAAAASGSWAGMAAAAVPELPRHPFGCRPNLVVVLTSHKTGTAQVRCITELVEQRYQPLGASSHYHLPEDVHHVARFAAQPLNGSSKDAGPSCPPFKLYSAGHHLSLLEDEGCPGYLPCPCTGEQQRCFALETGTLDIPAGNTTVVQSDIGVPHDSLLEIRAFKVPGESLYSFMRSLPPEQGVKLQYWQSAWDLFGTARAYASLQRQQRFLRFLPIRFEDLQRRYNATATTLLEAIRERLPPLDVPAMLNTVQVCHLSSWDPKDVATNVHVTSHRNPALRAALRRVLFADPLISKQLCELSALFGYNEVPECAAAAEGAAVGGT